MRELGMEKLVSAKPFIVAEASKAELGLVAERELVDQYGLRRPCEERRRRTLKSQ